MTDLLPVLMPVVKDMSGQWRAFMGIPAQGELAEAYASASSYANAPADEAWVFACIQRLYMDAQGVPLVVYRKNGKSREPVSDTTDQRGKDIQYLIDNVNDQSMTGSDFKAWHIASMGLYGEDYWKKVRGRFGGPPQELYWLSPINLKESVGASWIDGYTYRSGRPGVADEAYKAKDVLGTRTPNLKNPYRGLSPIASIRYELAVNRQAALHTAYTLANWGMPAVAWVAPKGAELTPQDQSAIRRALQALRGPRNSGKSAIIPEGLEPKVLSMTSKDAEWIEARKISRMTICAALGVPLVLAGDDEKTTVYANLRDAERVYWRGSMIPKLDRHAESMNNWLLPDFGADARSTYVIAYDFGQIEALRPALDVEMTAWALAMDRTAVTPNEYRRRFAIGPDKPWGDDPIRSTRLLQEPPTEFGATDPQEVPSGVLPVETTQPPVPTELRSIKNLYRLPAVKAWLADRGQPITAVAEALGVHPSDALRVGIGRNYSPAQLLDGVPAEGFAGIGDNR